MVMEFDSVLTETFTSEICSSVYLSVSLCFLRRLETYTTLNPKPKGNQINQIKMKYNKGVGYGLRCYV